MYECLKWIDSLLKIPGTKIEYENLEIRFHKRKVSFLVVKIVKYKRCATLITGSAVL